MTSEDLPGRNRYLVLHDYGMGGSWWWIRATSAEEILDSIAEVEIVTDPQMLERATTWDDMEEVDLRTIPVGPLAELAEQRSGERSHPAYGRLADRERVYIREDEDGEMFLTELGPDGRRLRQVGVKPDGEALRSESWPFNAPFDLRSPTLAEQEVSAEFFEKHWTRARPDPDAEDEDEDEDEDEEWNMDD